MTCERQTARNPRCLPLPGSRDQIELHCPQTLVPTLSGFAEPCRGANGVKTLQLHADEYQCLFEAEQARDRGGRVIVPKGDRLNERNVRLTPSPEIRNGVIRFSGY